MAVAGYGAALILLLLAFAVDGHGDAGHYLFSGALISTATTTGILLRSIRIRRN